MHTHAVYTRSSKVQDIIMTHKSSGVIGRGEDVSGRGAGVVALLTKEEVRG